MAVMELQQKPARTQRPYHHGDLRRTLLDAAVTVTSEKGPAGLSVREVSRRVGVSHAAGIHHFRDKRGLLTAVATEGFQRLRSQLGAAWEASSGSFLEVGVAYVRFAFDQRPYFEVMFRPDLYRADDPELSRAKREAAALLYGGVASVLGDGVEMDRLTSGVAAWSLMHGLATLWLTDNLPAGLGDDPAEVARKVGRHLF